MLNRIWSRPRGEWTRVLRKELPAVAAKLVDELLRNTPAFAAITERVGRDAMRTAVEQALLLSLGIRGDAGGGHAPVALGPVDPVHSVGSAAASRAVSGRVVTAMPGARARQALFAAIAEDRCLPDDVLAGLARRAGWPLPARVRAVALTAASANDAPHLALQLQASLGQGLLGTVDNDVCLLIPDGGPETRAALVAVLCGRVAAVGHAVPVADAASSLRWARRLLALAPPGGSPKERLVFVDDHLSDLLLLQDESLARALSARWLRPLEGLTPRQSERLEVTLLAWLESGGAPEAARTLQVHPQTVRYRLRQIEKLFGPALREPRLRFELELALRSRRLLAQARRLRSQPGGRARAVGAVVHPLGLAREARVNGL
ncbi:helix-turn-helix domain-containing protein [Streptomyces sp. ISL-11]|uniref:PucR family transcriptional regulator n=1 Tax=Streptomyces sp. ISL-11 TaxID=2819174 RepID=UPI0027E4321F|nr:helix-turn-helix domain-containing protein [Streptomyces sp. ISL-11]